MNSRKSQSDKCANGDFWQKKSWWDGHYCIYINFSIFFEFQLFFVTLNVRVLSFGPIFRGSEKYFSVVFFNIFSNWTSQWMMLYTMKLKKGRFQNCFFQKRRGGDCGLGLNISHPERFWLIYTRGNQIYDLKSI
jgi:hypothetical protein